MGDLLRICVYTTYVTHCSFHLLILLNHYYLVISIPVSVLQCYIRGQREVCVSAETVTELHELILLTEMAS